MSRLILSGSEFVRIRPLNITGDFTMTAEIEHSSGASDNLRILGTSDSYNYIMVSTTVLRIRSSSGETDEFDMSAIHAYDTPMTVIVTKTGTNISASINGTDLGTNTSNITTPLTYDLIGANYTSSNVEEFYSTGLINYIRISGSSDDREWNIEEGTGGTLLDASSTSSDAVFAGTGTTWVDEGSGEFSIQFDGNGWLSLPSIYLSTFVFTAEVSGAPQSDSRLFSMNSGSEVRPLLSIGSGLENTSKLKVFYDYNIGGAPSSSIESTASVFDGTRHKVSVEFIYDTANIYIDDVLDSTLSIDLTDELRQGHKVGNTTIGNVDRGGFGLGGFFIGKIYNANIQPLGLEPTSSIDYQMNEGTGTTVSNYNLVSPNFGAVMRASNNDFHWEVSTPGGVSVDNVDVDNIIDLGQQNVIVQLLNVNTPITSININNIAQNIVTQSSGGPNTWLVTINVTGYIPNGPNLLEVIL